MLLFVGLAIIRIDFIDTLDFKLYDMLMRFRANAGNSNIVQVEIDDDSIEKLGRWPWPRSLLAKGIQAISAGKPRVIGLDIILSEPERNAGLQEIQSLDDIFRKTLLDQTGESGAAFARAMSDAQQRLDNDRILTNAIIASGCVVLPFFFRESAAADTTEPPGRNPLSGRSAIHKFQNPEHLDYPRSNNIVLPIPMFLEAAIGAGHINLNYDIDGKARRERTFYGYHGLLYPSYAVRLVAAYLNVPMNAVRTDIGNELWIDNIKIPLTAYSEVLIGFKGERGAFKRYSFYDVVNDKVPASLFHQKLVLVHTSAAGIMNPLSTPTDAAMSVGEFNANAVWSILNHRCIQEPMWGSITKLGIMLCMGLMVAFIFPRLRSVMSGVLFWTLLVMMIGTQTYLFVSRGLWIKSAYPVLQMIVSFIGVLTIQYFVTETSKEKVEGESAETNRMLGLSFQSQGMLDMAFDKFRRIPVDEQAKDVLYNLALDYERKRQFNKAASVFEYIETHDGKFRDAAGRKKKLMQLSDTMVFGDGLLGSGSSLDGMMMTGDGIRPTLGRYEIIRQLGKGAMGVVYLGKDPRINRTTAIKTFRFTEGLDPEQAKKMREQFFREAESAGTLSHPNIVTIYDAGEEQDLAYIAMEYLEGDSFEKFVVGGDLLPIRSVIDYVADIALALDYAHQKGVVHRDIKPANVMLLKNGVVKITDFGIARITAASQTQTGVVKGTPSYMSPEQFSGKKVDGRSDIFSLGAMMFQLLTGRLPFQGDSLPALMHQIMNEPHPDPRTLNPKIYLPLVRILDNALAKEVDKRYPRASFMGIHLKKLGEKIDAVTAAGKTADQKAI